MPQFESQASAVASGYATSASVAAPTGLVAGELLILHAYVEQLEVSPGVPVTITPPEGFVPLGTFPTSTQHIQATWWKVAGASEPADYLVSWEVGTWYELEIERVSGADTVDPIEGYAGNSAATGTASAPISVTTTGPDRLLVWCAGNYNNYRATDTWTAPTGWTLREGTRTLGVATLAQPTAATVADISGAATQNGPNAAVAFAIKPPSGTANPPIVDAGPAAAVDAGATFTRTATSTGGAIATHAWTLESGPGVTPGTVIGSAATLNYTAPATTGAYVLRYTGTNADGSDFDELTLTVTDPGGTGELIPTQITQTASAINPANSVTVTLATTPPADRLVLGVASFNKDAGTIGIPAGMTSRARQVAANCSGDVAEGTSIGSGTWTSTLNYGISAGLFVTDISDWAFRGSTTVFSATDVTTLPTADLGAAPAAGVVYAVLGVDSSWGNAGAFAGTPPVWSGGYEHVGVFQEATENPADAGGAAFALAKLDVAAGDPTACTVSWTGADQAYLHLVQFDVLAVGGDEPPPVGGVGSVLRDPRIGVDTIAVRTSGTNSIRIDFSTASNMANPVSSVSVTPSALGDAHVPIPAGLTPNRTYYFQVYSGAGYIGSIYQFATLPGPAQATWSFAFTSCRQHGDDAPVLGQVLGRGAGMFVHLGDAHYENINSTDAGLYRAADDEQYTQPDLSAALTTIPGTYVWSNHDYCGNLTGVDATGRETVQQVYRERVPHTTLPSLGGGIYHTFTAWGGRVRMIVLDTRSFREEVGDPSPRTMLGTEQLGWLQNLLATVTEPLTFICSAEGWHSSGDDDDWGFYQEERSTIAGWIEAADTECVFLCGDMHRAAIGRPADGTAGGVHVWHAGGVRQFDNGIKGGPYSDLASYHNGICGLVELEDTGTALTATFRVARAGTTDWSATDQVVVSIASTTGQLAATLPLPEAALTANVATSGALAASLPLPTSALTATVGTAGDLASTLPLPTAQLAGAVRVPGNLAATLPLPTTALDGSVTASGALAAVLPLPVAAIGAGGRTSGELNAALPLPTAALDARVYVSGTLAVSLALPVAELAATTVTTGQLAASLPLPVAELTATMRVTGELSAVLPLPVAALSDERKHLHGPALRASTPTVVRGLRAGEPAVVRGFRASELTATR